MNGPQRYRKLPVVIEAMRWNGTPEGATPIINWVLARDGTARYHEDRPGDTNVLIRPEHIAVDTLEGTMRANAGDWVIRGVQGEFYPCRDDVFRQSYEPVEAGS